MEAFAEGDLDAIMTDYCEDAMLLTPDGALRGSGETRVFFKAFLAHFSPGSVLEVSQQITERTIAYAVWSGRSAQLDIPFATETLIIREEKILAQTFAAQMEPSLDTAGRQHK